MKIGKLFHWLYAFLMLLPVGAVLGTTLYTIFNPNAKDSFSGSESYNSINYQFQTNDLENEDNLCDDIIDNNIYYLVDAGDEFIWNYWDALDLDTYYYTSTYFYGVYNPLVFVNEGSSYNGSVLRNFNYDYYYGREIGFYLTENNGVYNFDIVLRGISNPLLREVTDFSDQPFAFSFSLVFVVPSLSDFEQNGFILYDYCTYSLAVCPYEYIPYSTQLHTTSNLDNAFYYALDSVNTNPLFSWASASFLVQPFHYIGNLFGLPLTSPINTLLSYWLDISIIWLVFDVIMYVPLLVHRWLDKGGIE